MGRSGKRDKGEERIRRRGDEMGKGRKRDKGEERIRRRGDE